MNRTKHWLLTLVLQSTFPSASVARQLLIAVGMLITDKFITFCSSTSLSTPSLVCSLLSLGTRRTYTRTLTRHRNRNRYFYAPAMDTTPTPSDDSSSSTKVAGSSGSATPPNETTKAQGIATSSYAKSRGQLMALINELRSSGASLEVDVPRIVVIGLSLRTHTRCTLLTLEAAPCYREPECWKIIARRGHQWNQSSPRRRYVSSVSFSRHRAYSPTIPC